MEKVWKIFRKVPPEFIKKYPQYDPLVLQLLYNRGLETEIEIEKFFNPNLRQDLFDPYLLSDMEKAVKRIEQARLKKEKIGVYGDYDADGVTSSVLLVEFLKNIMKLQGQVYIPDRRSEGYGLNKKAIKWLSQKGVSLIITCDCGTSDKEEIDFARSLGLDVIVLDHHHVKQEFSKDYIVVNPKRKNDQYPFKELTGVGIVFKFIQAQGKTSFEYEKDLLDLVAVGTVADCAPIISENRTLVKFGLASLNKTKRLGFKCLIDKAHINPNKIDSWTIGFQIGPRINAAGRIDRATEAYRLLISKTLSEASTLAEKLEIKNRERQNLCLSVVKQAKEKIGKVEKDKKILFAGDEKWPLGVVGLVASKLSDEFSRPCFIFEKGKNQSSGSARSIPSFNVIEAISRCADILLEFGGHKMAAGFSLENKYLEEFYKRLSQQAEEKLTEQDLIPQIFCDEEITLGRVNLDFCRMLQPFEPYGPGNPKPIFLARKVNVLDVKLCGYEEKHLKLRVFQKDEKGCTHVRDLIGFNFADLAPKIKKGDLLDIVFTADISEWKGGERVEMKLVDLRPSLN